nr:immunoglobulin heavy chain junction region [Macaca mulatta]MOV87277.1 immunoglobulin heavy chain junction region [Macaca mulatta]MOV87505.1 immunoglobulin heavy chain junction region [Macaca mulatta]MOV87645.1 immunoglobulin heavy chain junction region [Macaca mulatta]MOV88112.1 immunoglobulin heavy chain junction region [Macaca mulatta]
CARIYGSNFPYFDYW